MNFTELIRNEKTAFWSAIGVIMLVQMPHLGFVWYQDSLFELQWMKIAISAFSAIFFDLGVLFFAVRGKILPTVIFMVSSAVITVRYYWEKILADGFTFGSVTLVLMAAIPALLIYFISHELNTDEKDFIERDVQENLKEAKIAKIRQLRAEGATWNEIQSATGASKQFISNALKNAS